MRCPTCERSYPEGTEYCSSDGARLAPDVVGSLDPLIGVVLEGRYRVIERIGGGGMGVVYRARQLNVDRDVAVKLLQLSALRTEKLVRRFENEARIISRLRHPGILKLIDFGSTPSGERYIVTEYLAGRPLSSALRDGPIGVDKALWIVAEAADALTEAHAAGIVHRDLKPENMFLEQIGRREVLKVLDFGIALFAEGSLHTTTGSAYGSPSYMSPEQARGEDVDARSDLYSLGIVAYECLAGRRPFRAPTPAAILLKHIHEPPPPLAPSEDPAVAQLIFSLLSKRREDRPPGAAEVHERVLALIEARKNRPSEASASLPSVASQLAPAADTGPPERPDLHAAPDAGPRTPVATSPPEARHGEATAPSPITGTPAAEREAALSLSLESPRPGNPVIWIVAAAAVVAAALWLVIDSSSDPVVIQLPAVDAGFAAAERAPAPPVPAPDPPRAEPEAAAPEASEPARPKRERPPPARVPKGFVPVLTKER